MNNNKIISKQGMTGVQLESFRQMTKQANRTQLATMLKTIEYEQQKRLRQENRLE